jgi:hypothetical protein
LAYYKQYVVKNNNAVNGNAIYGMAKKAQKRRKE